MHHYVNAFSQVFFLVAVLFFVDQLAGGMLPLVPEHRVLQGELAAANFALEGPLAAVRPHVAPEVFRRPEAAHAKGAHHLNSKKSAR